MSNVEANVDAKPKARDLLNKIVADHYQGRLGCQERRRKSGLVVLQTSHREILNNGTLR